jgi:hypothetical protein
MDNKKWALITVKGEQKMCFVDNKTMKAYEADGYKKTSTEIIDFKFNRWCTGHDL